MGCCWCAAFISRPSVTMQAQVQGNEEMNFLSADGDTDPVAFVLAWSVALIAVGYAIEFFLPSLASWVSHRRQRHRYVLNIRY